MMFKPGCSITLMIACVTYSRGIVVSERAEQVE